MVRNTDGHVREMFRIADASFAENRYLKITQSKSEESFWNMKWRFQDANVDLKKKTNT